MRDVVEGDDARACRTDRLNPIVNRMQLATALFVTLIAVAGCAGPPFRAAGTYVLVRGQPSGSLAFSNNDVFAATRWPSALVRIDRANGIQTVVILSRDDRNPSGVAFERRTQTVWIAEALRRYDGRESVAIVSRSGTVTELALPLHSARMYPEVVAVDARGAVWVAAAAAPLLWRIDAATHRILEISVALPITSMADDNHGGIWIVQAGHSIFRIDVRTLRSVKRYSAPSRSYIYAIASDERRLWYVRSTPGGIDAVAGFITTDSHEVRECPINGIADRIAASANAALVFRNDTSAITTVSPSCVRAGFSRIDIAQSIVADPFHERFWLVDPLRRSLVALEPVRRRF